MVNGGHIYPLVRKKPIRVALPTNPARFVVTDGYHITPAVAVKYNPQKTTIIYIECIIKNDVLVGLLLFTLLLFAMGASSGLWVLFFLAMLPVMGFLFFFYIKKQSFIQLVQHSFTSP